MNQTLKLPVGIENFEDIRKLGFYYIDKTKSTKSALASPKARRAKTKKPTTKPPKNTTFSTLANKKDDKKMC